ncbi:MAG: hypothetical protein BAJALOKI1v1_2400004 [Promethearchaeota archaeon]|nr:MAG: hypothetical protein BAJALOKI1v1_2400004 [Candidatus Lokiarchaeota archaeon]
MLVAHSITVEIFVQPKENADQIRTKLLSLFPFDLKEEKIELYEKSVMGFNKELIKVLRVELSKNKHINAFFDNIITQLSEQTKQLIRDQARKRLDPHLNFFLRFDKQNLLTQNLYKLTEQGDCIYIKFKIAAFPKNEENALKIIYELFK